MAISIADDAVLDIGEFVRVISNEFRRL